MNFAQSILLILSLVMSVQAADESKLRIRLMDSHGRNKELKQQKDYAQLPLQHLQMASGAIEDRLNQVINTDLRDVSSDELEVAAQILEDNISGEYRDWLDHMSGHCSNLCCGVVVIAIAASALSAGLKYIGVDTGPDNAGAIALAVGCPVAGFVQEKHNHATRPDQSKKEAALERMVQELEDRKNK